MLKEIKSAARFATGAALFSPLLAVEDTLRYLKVPISEHGLFKNDEGKGMLEIWNECAPVPTEKKAAERTKTHREIFEEQYRVSIKADEDKAKGSFNASVNVQKL
jgi:hypothetical protein